MKLKNTDSLRRALASLPDEGRAKATFNVDVFRWSGPAEVARYLRDRAVRHRLEAIVTMANGLFYHRVTISVTGDKAGLNAIANDVDRLHEVSEAE